MAQIVFPHELLGELLIERGEPAKALREFETSLRAEPNRFRGLYGAAKAAELSGDREKGKDILCEASDSVRASRHRETRASGGQGVFGEEVTQVDIGIHHGIASEAKSPYEEGGGP